MSFVGRNFRPGDRECRVAGLFLVLCFTFSSNFFPRALIFSKTLGRALKVRFIRKRLTSYANAGSKIAKNQQKVTSYYTCTSLLLTLFICDEVRAQNLVFMSI